ncbi:cytochrome P450 [Actinosynnema pretiosum]|uniref:Bifunctional cytochrome P450/NADPH--P450 reductase n=3 Tax=Actinosynnema TaxID=40566 RepID=A0A290Z6R1_9PSEU|nr:cytochrome P450 [Actinosynnema pretiosum]AAM54108.1 cytochrome P450 [Actinosynnema pretiosum subsp. auranticum]ATE54653.1 cytochrome [Actinosynnema pretiosum]
MVATGTRIPGPKPLPLVGNLLDVLTSDLDTDVDFLDRCHREHGGIVALTFAGQRQVFASSHELVARMCSDPSWGKAVHPALEQVRDFAGDGLFTARGDEPNWGKAHRLLMPAFGPTAMRDHFPAMLDIAEQMLVRWRRFGPDHRIDVADDMTRLTLDTIALCAFGARFNSFYRDRAHPFVDAMVRSLVEAGERAERLPGVQPFLVGRNQRYRDDIATMNRIADGIVAARAALPAGERPDDLLERMLTCADPVTGERLSARNVRYQLATFLIAGHETTSGLLSFAVHRLLAHPEVLRKAKDAVDGVLGDRVPAFEDLARLDYLGQVLRETLRLHPTAPAFALAPDEPAELGGHAIGAGEPVLVMLPTLHRDPAVWRDPDVFDPERFAPERMDEIPACAWMPFGHGARACIGRPFALQEATLVLALVLQRFDLALADPDHRLTIKQTLTLKPDSLVVRARPRADRPGATATVETVVPHQVPATHRHGTPLHVFYGSNGGSGEGLARTIAGDGAARGWATSVAPLDDAVRALPASGPVVIVSSSYNGAPPDNAAHFVRWLTQDGPDLSGVDYLVLGCGNLDWSATYQRVPTLIDEAMAAAGARRLRERGATDARADFFGDWERWYEPLWPLLSAECGVEVGEIGPRFRVVESDAADGLGDLASAVVLENRELVRGPDAGSKRHLELRLPDGTSYRTGDYLSVLPQNHPDLVRRAVARLGTRAERVVTVESSAPTGLVPVGRALRVDELLTRCVDLSAPAGAGVVARLAERCPCPPERAELAATTGATLLELLERFPSCAVDLALALELLPAPRTRLYSISSAAEEQRAEVALTVSVTGVTSGYLSRVRPGDRVAVGIASPPESFRPPADNTVPVVLIAAGTGIAPFRGFLRARAALGGEPGPALLLFGCRGPELDDLYAEEFAALGDWLEVDRAYSRHPDGEVRHVQHRLWQRRDRVRELVDAGARVYLCGDATRVGPAVEEVLGRIGPGAGWLDALRAGGRYATDVF